MSLFDQYKRTMVDKTTEIMGYPATWSPSLGGATYEAKVHFRKPNHKDIIRDGVEYMPSNFFMEYLVADFPGLQEAVRSTVDQTEIVTINGTDYYVRSINRVYDGDTYQAVLELKP